MLISAAMTGTSLQLTGHYRTNERNVQKSMVRVATGTRFQRPSDAIAEYFRSQQFKADIRGQQQIARELSFGAALLDATKEVGHSVFEDLTKMQELMKVYYHEHSNHEERSGAQASFNAIKNRIADIVDNAWYDGRKLVSDNGGSPLMSMILDPRDISLTFDISYNAADITDTAGLTLGAGLREDEEAALQAQLNRAASYLAKSVVYSDAVASHQYMLAHKNIQYMDSIENNESADDGVEMMRLVKQSLNLHMNASMMAQANLFRSGIANLLNVNQ